MSIQSEITRIQNDRNVIRTKLVDLKLVTSVATLDDCATAINGITNRGSVSATVQEGDTYTIPAGYHDGSGTVSGVAGGGNYSLQSKSVTPTKSSQPITADSGYYGLSDVTVAAIPDNYQDVTPVTATAADVLATKVIVSSTGATVAGTMTNNGAVTKTLDTETTSYTIPKGYHSGTGTVNITPESLEVTPTKSAQEFTPGTGKVYGAVNIKAIPDLYIDTTIPVASAASAGDILTGKEVYVNGSKVTGTMANNGAYSKAITGFETDDNGDPVTSWTSPAGYYSSVSVSLTNDIETALAAI